MAESVFENFESPKKKVHKDLRSSKLVPRVQTLRRFAVESNEICGFDFAKISLFVVNEGCLGCFNKGLLGV